MILPKPQQLAAPLLSDFKKQFTLYKSNPELQLEFFRLQQPQQIPQIFKQDLEPDLFLQVMKTLKLVEQGQRTEYLKAFAQVSRFGICVKCLLKREKQGNVFMKT